MFTGRLYEIDLNWNWRDDSGILISKSQQIQGTTREREVVHDQTVTGYSERSEIHCLSCILHTQALLAWTEMSISSNSACFWSKIVLLSDLECFWHGKSPVKWKRYSGQCAVLILWILSGAYLENGSRSKQTNKEVAGLTMGGNLGSVKGPRTLWHANASSQEPKWITHSTG